jgi:hypothetical protein
MQAASASRQASQQWGTALNFLPISSPVVV